MPALPSVPDVIKVVLKGRKSAKAWANVLHYVYSGAPPSLSDVTAVASDVAGFWNTFMKPRATADAQLEGVEVTDLASPMGSQVDHIITPIVGTNGEDPLPNNVAFLSDYPVALRYRGGHPRTYWLGGGDGDLFSAGSSWILWNPAFVVAMGTSIQGMLNSLPGATYGGTVIGDQCAVRYNGGGARLVTPIVLPLTSFSVEVNVASQRRRSRIGS